MKGITAVILAAGQGKRMNTQVAKQFLMLQGNPVLYYAIQAFEDSSVDEIVLVTGEGQVEYCKENMVSPYKFKKVSSVIEGGKERYDSVYEALLHINTDYILIHDGARPFISKEMIEEIIVRVKECDACILGTPVKETIKVVDKDGLISETPNRNYLWAAQTPQAFAYPLIKEAYDSFHQEADKKGIGITDDAMVYERYCKRPVRMLMGDYNNIKLTTPEDLIMAEEIAKLVLCKKNI